MQKSIFTKIGVKEAESLARGWIVPLYFDTALPRYPLVVLTTLLLSLIGLREEHLKSL
jgi:hypothetical protein